MDPIVVDDALRAKLILAKGLVEFRDASGRLLGQYVPAPPAQVYIIEGQLASDEELDRREREDPRFTPDQVADRLRHVRGKRHAG